VEGQRRSELQAVTAGYFDAIRIRLRAGGSSPRDSRTLLRGDRQRKYGDALWPGKDPLATAFGCVRRDRAGEFPLQTSSRRG